MIIQCEACRTKFNVDESLIKSEGSKVKCSRCENVFIAYPPEKIETDEHQDILAAARELETQGQKPEAKVGEEMSPYESYKEEPMDDIEDLEVGFYESDQEVSEEAEKPIAVSDKKKGKSYKMPIFVLIIIFLLGAGAVVYFRAPHVISDFLTLTEKSTESQKSADMGANRLEILTVDGSFVESEKAGRLFVIQGRLRNNYSKSRTFILVKGSILDEKGQAIKEKSAYAGNTFKDELTLLTLEEINKALSNRHGIEKRNLNVMPGATIDFMIVFGNLPDNLSEFTVGAVSSSPAFPETKNQT